MPLYEYQCESCGHVFEVIQKFSDSPVETCPECGGKVQKMPSAPAIQFKGSGWYVTDYGKRGGGGNGREPAAREKDKKGEKPATASSEGSENAGSGAPQASKSDPSPSKSADSPPKSAEKA
jgi:putative FmdB family regulatory protein